MTNERLLAICPPVFSFCPLLIVLGLQLPALASLHECTVTQAATITVGACFSMIASVGLGLGLTTLFASHMRHRKELQTMDERMRSLELVASAADSGSQGSAPVDHS